MPELMKDYIRFPTVEHFERYLYAVAYSPQVPSHVKLKRSNILIWRDYPHQFIRICLQSPIYSGTMQHFLRKDESIKMFRPNAYYILQDTPAQTQATQIAMIQGRIARIPLDDHAKVYRICQLFKQYLYFTTFIKSLKQASKRARKELMDCFEAVQGHY
jgi:hypothetical protein